MEKLKINNLENKLNSWNQKRLQIDTIVDGLGTPIDENIKDTVVALQISGVQTTSSHEGKVGHYPIPYVDIESHEAEGLMNRYSEECMQLISQEERDLRKERDILLQQWRLIDNPEDLEYQRIEGRLDEVADALAAFPRVTSETSKKIKDQLLESNRLAEYKISQLLENFYSSRAKHDEYELVLKPVGMLGAVRLLPKNYEHQEQELDEIRILERLKQYQAEMRAFTDYIKQQYIAHK